MSRIPNIIKETSEGLNCIPIQDALFQQREIICIDEITAASAAALILQLRYLQREAPEQEITLYIDSPGGETNSGLAVYDAMQSISCPIRTVCTGMAASMAAVLFAAGDKRDILPHSEVMIHDPLTTGTSGSALKLDAEAARLMRTRQTIAEIISRHTGRSIDEVLAKTADDSWFSAEQAVEWGLADRVIHEL